VLSRRPIIYFGAFGRGLFQSMYEPPSSLLSYLPFTLEWNAIGLVLFLSAVVTPSALPLAMLPLAVSVVWSVATAARARVDPRFHGLRSRALIALLTYLGPLVRGLQRYLWRLRGFGRTERVEFEGPQQPARIDWLRRTFTVGYWSEQGHEKEALLAGLMDFLIPRKYLIAVDPGWNRWDVEVYRGIWAKARIAVAVENHGGTKRVLNVRCEVRLTRVSELALAGYAIATATALFFRIPELAAVGVGLGIVTLGVVVAENLRLGQILNDSLDIVAGRLGLRPLGASVPAPRAQAA
jgi:hypothetical protein